MWKACRLDNSDDAAAGPKYGQYGGGDTQCAHTTGRKCGPMISTTENSAVAGAMHGFNAALPKPTSLWLARSDIVACLATTSRPIVRRSMDTLDAPIVG
jgi:hypothetical protein